MLAHRPLSYMQHNQSSNSVHSCLVKPTFYQRMTKFLTCYCFFFEETDNGIKPGFMAR